MSDSYLGLHVSQISIDNIRERVLKVVKAHEEVKEPDAVTTATNFRQDLGLDSLAHAELVMQMEGTFRLYGHVCLYVYMLYECVLVCMFVRMCVNMGIFVCLCLCLCLPDKSVVILVCVHSCCVAPLSFSRYARFVLLSADMGEMMRLLLFW